MSMRQLVSSVFILLGILWGAESAYGSSKKETFEDVNLENKLLRVLSCGGGWGAQVLMQAGALEALRHTTKKPIHECFDIVTGVNMGGLLATFVAMKVPMPDILRFFALNATELYSGPKTLSHMRKVLLRYIKPEKKLGDVSNRLFLFCMSKAGLMTFDSHAVSQKDLNLLDILVASMAMPGIYP
ncbi:MAG: patatin-like phospholipase family protein, partial [Alphaproteobacteria bacterium]